MVYLGWAMQILRNLILSCGDLLGFALRKEPKPLILKDWLGGLDSNQDSQIQSLESYQLDDLPAAEKSRLTSYRDLFLLGKHGKIQPVFCASKPAAIRRKPLPNAYQSLINHTLR